MLNFHLFTYWQQLIGGLCKMTVRTNLRRWYRCNAIANSMPSYMQQLIAGQCQMAVRLTCVGDIADIVPTYAVLSPSNFWQPLITLQIVSNICPCDCGCCRGEVVAERHFVSFWQALYSVLYSVQSTVYKLVALIAIYVAYSLYSPRSCTAQWTMNIRLGWFLTFFCEFWHDLFDLVQKVQNIIEV